MSDSDNEDDTMPKPNMEPSNSEEEQTLKEAKGDKRPRTGIKGCTIASLFGVPKYYTFKIKGQRITALVDGGAIHNFINVALVARRGIPTEEFVGFKVTVADKYNMTCI